MYRKRFSTGSACDSFSSRSTLAWWRVSACHESCWRGQVLAERLVCDPSSWSGEAVLALQALRHQWPLKSLGSRILRLGRLWRPKRSCSFRWTGLPGCRRGRLSSEGLPPRLSISHVWDSTQPLGQGDSLRSNTALTGRTHINIRPLLAKKPPNARLGSGDFWKLWTFAGLCPKPQNKKQLEGKWGMGGSFHPWRPE